MSPSYLLGHEATRPGTGIALWDSPCWRMAGHVLYIMCVGHCLLTYIYSKCQLICSTRHPTTYRRDPRGRWRQQLLPPLPYALYVCSRALVVLSLWLCVRAILAGRDTGKDTHISHRPSILQHLGIWPSIWLAAPTAPAAAAPDCYFQHDGAGSMSHSGEMGASRREDQWVPDASG
jgi:hypothetical protein